jgi:hypothetical protein
MTWYSQLLSSDVKSAGTEIANVYKIWAYILPDPSSSTIAPGFVKPVTEMSTRRFLRVKNGWHVKLIT